MSEKEYADFLASQSTQEVIAIPKRLAGYIIGKDSTHLRGIEKQFNITIYTPPRDDSLINTYVNLSKEFHPVRRELISSCRACV